MPGALLRVAASSNHSSPKVPCFPSQLSIRGLTEIARLWLQSDHASAVVEAFEREAKKKSADFHFEDRLAADIQER